MKNFDVVIPNVGTGVFVDPADLSKSLSGWLIHRSTILQSSAHDPECYDNVKQSFEDAIGIAKAFPNNNVAVGLYHFQDGSVTISIYERYDSHKVAKQISIDRGQDQMWDCSKGYWENITK